MKIAVTSSRTEKTYVLTVDDGEIRPQPYNRAGRQYRVTRVVVVKADGNVYSVTISGPVLKKDGSDSLNAASERMYKHSDWPEWLVGAIGGLA